MNHSTEGIVLHYFDYSDSSVIVKIYTEKFGLQSYIVNGVRKKKAKITLNLFQALTILDLEVTYKEKSNLQRIIEIKPLMSLNHDTDFIKNTILLFLKEVIYKSIKEEEANQNLFLFLKEAVLVLNTTHQNVANFHIAFMLELSRHLGFYPHLSDGDYFNIEEGEFHHKQSGQVLNMNYSSVFKQFIITDWRESYAIQLTGSVRKTVLTNIIRFYKTHIDSFGDIKSLEVLQTIIN